MTRWLLGAVLLASWGCLPAAEVAPQPLAQLNEASATDGQGQPVAIPELLTRLERADLVCLGEQHDDADHHRFQQALWQALARQSARDGRPLALGLEMVQQPFQPAVNDYLRGHLNARELAHELDWKRRWGYDFAFFRPLFHSAHELGADVLALNAPRELTRNIARHGVESLSAREQAQLPDLDLDNADHRRFFWDAMGFNETGGAHGPPSTHDKPPSHSDKPPNHPQPGHKHPSHQQPSLGQPTHQQPSHGQLDHKPPGHDHQPASHGAPAQHRHGAASVRQLRFYTAQVIWDETMAAAASNWLSRHEGGRMLLLAGNGHCHQSAIVGRVKRRTAVDALSVLLAPKEAELSPHAKRDYLVRVKAAAAEPVAPAPHRASTNTAR